MALFRFNHRVVNRQYTIFRVIVVCFVLIPSSLCRQIVLGLWASCWVIASWARVLHPPACFPIYISNHELLTPTKKDMLTCSSRVMASITCRLRSSSWLCNSVCSYNIQWVNDVLFKIETYCRYPRSWFIVQCPHHRVLAIIPKEYSLAERGENDSRNGLQYLCCIETCTNVIRPLILPLPFILQ